MDINKYISSGVVEDYVLGLISDNERVEIERMRRVYPELDKSIRRYEEDLEKYSNLYAVEPPESLKEKLLKGLDTVSKETEETSEKEKSSVESEKHIPIRRYKQWKRMAVAAVILFLISAGLNGYLFPKYKKYKNRYIAVTDNQEQILAQNKILKTKVAHVEQGLQALMNPDMKPVTMEGVNTHKDMVATVFWNTRNQKVYLGKMNLPVPPTGKAYQLWAIVDGTPVSLGMYNPKKDKGIKAMKNLSAKNIQAFAITLEVAKGSATPTMDQMYVMGSPS